MEASKKREAAYAKVLTPMASAEAQKKLEKPDKTITQALKDGSTQKPKKPESKKEEPSAKKDSEVKKEDDKKSKPEKDTKSEEKPKK